ncbi:MAG: hypothetical protein SGPRY_005566, partial [Prymnesium sp.]
EAAKHWSHVLFVEELCRTKADNDRVFVKLQEQAERLEEVDENHTVRVDKLTASTEKHNHETDEYLKHLDERLTKEEATMLTKSTLVEAQELRDKIAMCALRHETRELVDAIRQEVASRVRMMKERLDRTDHELMRQLEAHYALDKREQLQSVRQQLDSKAEKETLERVSESSQQLFSELQALHVRTQTLGQGMKVVLGWPLPLARPKTSIPPSGGGGGMVSVKPSMPSLGGSSEANPYVSEKSFMADLVGDISGTHIAGPAGAALGSPRGVVPPMGGKMSPLSSCVQAGSLPSAFESRPSPSSHKSESDRRRHQLDQKRADIVEARLGSNQSSSPRGSTPALSIPASPEGQLSGTPAIVQPLVPVPPSHPPTSPLKAAYVSKGI